MILSTGLTCPALKPPYSEGRTRRAPDRRLLYPIERCIVTSSSRIDSVNEPRQLFAVVSDYEPQLGEAI